MTTRTVQSSDDVELALHHLGGTGPTLLVCHATGFHGRAYQVFADALGDRFEMWALDFRGHGASSAPTTGDFAWSGMADDVLACVDALGGGPVPAFGHSLGGAAILLAELARPSTISRAALFEPVVFPREVLEARTENPMAGPARHRRPEFDSRAAAAERYGSRPPLAALHPQALADYVEFGFVDTPEGAVRLACEPEHEARVFEAEAKLDIDTIRGLYLDAWVGVGTTDVPGPALFAATVADAIDGAVLAPHPELGHFGPLEDPGRIAAEVGNFLLE